MSIIERSPTSTDEKEELPEEKKVAVSTTEFDYDQGDSEPWHKTVDQRTAGVVNSYGEEVAKAVKEKEGVFTIEADLEPDLEAGRRRISTVLDEMYLNGLVSAVDTEEDTYETDAMSGRTFSPQERAYAVDTIENEDIEDFVEPYQEIAKSGV